METETRQKDLRCFLGSLREKNRGLSEGSCWGARIRGVIGGRGASSEGNIHSESGGKGTHGLARHFHGDVYLL